MSALNPAAATFVPHFVENDLDDVDADHFDDGEPFAPTSPPHQDYGVYSMDPFSGSLGGEFIAEAAVDLDPGALAFPPSSREFFPLPPYETNALDFPGSQSVPVHLMPSFNFFAPPFQPRQPPPPDALPITYPPPKNSTHSNLQESRDSSSRNAAIKDTQRKTPFTPYEPRNNGKSTYLIASKMTAHAVDAKPNAPSKEKSVRATPPHDVARPYNQSVNHPPPTASSPSPSPIMSSPTPPLSFADVLKSQTRNPPTTTHLAKGGEHAQVNGSAREEEGAKSYAAAVHEKKNSEVFQFRAPRSVAPPPNDGNHKEPAISKIQNPSIPKNKATSPVVAPSIATNPPTVSPPPPLQNQRGVLKIDPKLIFGPPIPAADPQLPKVRPSKRKQTFAELIATPNDDAPAPSPAHSSIVHEAVEVLPLKGHKLKLKPKPLSKTKRAVLEHREVLFKRMLEEKGESFEEHMKDELVEINRELVETAKKFNMPLRKMGEREKRDQLLKKVPHIHYVYDAKQPVIRPYVNQFISRQLNDLVREHLETLHRFQLRTKEKEPTKAKIKQRFVAGLREVLKAITVGKAKYVVVAPNIEPNPTPDGLDALLDKILEAAHERSMPVIYALSSKKLGQAINRTAKASAVAVKNYDGTDFKLLKRTAKRLRLEFEIAHRVKLLQSRKLQGPEQTQMPTAAPEVARPDTPPPPPNSDEKRDVAVYDGEEKGEIPIEKGEQGEKKDEVKTDEEIQIELNGLFAALKRVQLRLTPLKIGSKAVLELPHPTLWTLFVSAADEMFDLTLEKLDPKVVTVRDLKLSIEDAFRTKQNPPRKADAVPDETKVESEQVPPTSRPAWNQVLVFLDKLIIADASLTLSEVPYLASYSSLRLERKK